MPSKSCCAVRRWHHTFSVYFEVLILRLEFVVLGSWQSRWSVGISLALAAMPIQFHPSPPALPTFSFASGLGRNHAILVDLIRADFIYAIVITGIIYPVVAHWAWAETGWASPYRREGVLLAGCGVADFSGSGVVHVTGAFPTFKRYCSSSKELVLVGTRSCCQPNPTQPNPTQPNPTQPNPRLSCLCVCQFYLSSSLGANMVLRNTSSCYL